MTVVKRVYLKKIAWMTEEEFLFSCYYWVASKFFFIIFCRTIPTPCACIYLLFSFSGDTFERLEDEDEQGWCKGQKDGKVGLYPANYIEVE